MNAEATKSTDTVKAESFYLTVDEDGNIGLHRDSEDDARQDYADNSNNDGTVATRTFRIDLIIPRPRHADGVVRAAISDPGATDMPATVTIEVTPA